MGLLVNAENFEKQAEKATSQAKSSKTPTVPAESKETREKREKMEKLLKKADDATAAKRFSEAMTWLKQARVLAPSEKQKEIDEKMQEVQKQASEGSLFGMTEEPAPVIPQPQGSMNGQPQPGMQTSIFPEQQTHTMNPEPVMQSAPQQIPQGMFSDIRCLCVALNRKKECAMAHSFLTVHGNQLFSLFPSSKPQSRITTTCGLSFNRILIEWVPSPRPTIIRLLSPHLPGSSNSPAQRG